MCGTPGYWAPELLEAATAGQRVWRLKSESESESETVAGYGLKADLWACGVIMYTL